MKIYLFLLLLIIIIYLYNKKENYDNFNVIEKDYIIIGGGPAGLQTGYFLKKYEKNYLILEKSNNVGNFFKKYPIHRKLISINKVNTGNKNKDFNLRHDWNSLLSDNDDLLFTKYTKKYFPDAKMLVKYLNDFYIKNNLNVEFNSEVKKIDKIHNTFYIYTKNNTYKTKKLIIATGLFKQNKIDIPGIINYSDLTLNKTKFQNKNVLILGQGNSAFEVADYLIDTSAIIHIGAKKSLKFAWQTHYPGDLRAINNNFLDTYQLKSQNGIFEFDIKYAKIILKNKKYYIHDTINKNLRDQLPENGYDYIINCTGFSMDNSIFGNIKPKNNGKIPIINNKFESINVPNLFIAGTLMQYKDFKKSSSAFIHGFRYLIRTMVRLETHNLKKNVIGTKKELFSKIIHRINNSSGLYQMFNTLVDVVIFENNKIIYIEEVLYCYALDTFKNMLIIKFNYGDFGGVIEYTKNLGKSSYVFGLDRVKGITDKTAHLSNFLHPILELYNNGKIVKTKHIAEHFTTTFKLENEHKKPLKEFLENMNLK